jgi:acyl transferase domain-containing protein/NADP-dependent 3-hydroxy acid dehydrogenase YdfG/acyl-CoA thioesterase FadM/acyl carrier protein
MACWYPDARSPKELWGNILARRIQFRRYLDCRLPMSEYHHPDRSAPDKTYGSRAAYIDGYAFAWASHRIPLSTFKSMDIAHWLALDVVLQALDDTRYVKETLPNEKTGVIVGNTLTGEQSRSSVMRLRWPFIKRAFTSALRSQGVTWSQINPTLESAERHFKSVFPPVTEDTLAGGLSNTIAGRICNYLNLHGGGYTIDGACSSSLLAVANAATGLASGQLDLALAGGVDISLDPFEIIGFSKTNALTMGDMNVYDRRGSGFIPGEGCGFVVLKRLSDAMRDGDYIYAVIHGWGISSDGGGTGLTAPSPEGQARSIRRAYEFAPFDMDALAFIEGHGTGTTVGDRVELTAISLAMEQASREPGRTCGVTSLKSIIGHTKAASGIGAFIKAVMAVNQRVLPPTASCKEPHQIFDDKALKLYPILEGEVRPPESILRAGVSSMGFGGINCHITVESGNKPTPKLTPDISEKAIMAGFQETEIFIFTSDNTKTLQKSIDDVLTFSEAISQSEMADLACKMSGEIDINVPIRAAVVAGSPDELTIRLKELREMVGQFRIGNAPQANALHTVWLGQQRTPLRIGMLFPGQGTQKLNMARIITHRFPWAQEMLDQADRFLMDLGAEPVSRTIYHPLEWADNAGVAERWFRQLSKTQNAQPAIVTASALWFHYLKRLGISPSVIGGHSLGELSAFFAADAYGFEELIKLAAIRGRSMAAADENAGMMASLRCDRETVEGLIARTSEYIVLANINGPEQMVISGTRAGVETVAQLAEEKNINVHRLFVSNAFHSRMMQKSSDVLARTDVLPEKPVTLRSRLFSGVTGMELPATVDLRAYFSNQVISQVDFVSMIKAMSQACDLFIEVGSGRVISGLVNAINGQGGPRSLPTESLPELDKDLSKLLAVLFTHGVDITWENVFSERLIKPFISPYERVFIDNPCERPFVLDEVVQEVIREPSPGMIEQAILETAHFSEEELKTYLAARAPFLAEVIQADLTYSSAERLQPRALPRLTPAAVKEKQAPRPPSTGDSVASILFNLIGEITGFPRESLKLEMRILDDLNLDSIKAGDLIARLASKTGARGDLAAARLNNATLAEVIKTISAMLPDQVLQTMAAGEAAAETPDTENLVFSTIQEITGYPGESLKADMRLLDDLNMDSIKAGDLIVRLVKKAGVSADQLDPRQLANASLAELIHALGGLSIKPSVVIQTATPVEAPYLPQDKTWVREFAVSYEAAPLLVNDEDRGQWHSANLLILSDADTLGIASAMQRSLFPLGAQLKIEGYEEAAKAKLTENPNFSHVIALLPPKEPSREMTDDENLRQTIVRLAMLSNLPLSRQRPATLAYVQFGGGYSGRTGSGFNYRTCCASALAKSIHLERSDLKVRVLDFCADADAVAVAGRIIHELENPGLFTEAGYDETFTRRTSIQKVVEPATYPSRGIEWTADDVIVVTGGARGITASCAFDLATKTGARMALLGRTPQPEGDSGNDEIRQLLERYAKAGLTARYFACDVASTESVNQVIGQIEAEMGMVTAVVHGAGLNVPRLCQDVAIEQAIAEVSPKILGAMNLIHALEGKPLKLIAALNSIIGTTGMQGNAWYGFSNDVLDLILRQFKACHPDTHIISIAYSIWGEEGMGFRMGSVGLLKHQGIEGIPSDEGVKRFTRLCLSDPGTPLILVTARLGGLDTLNIPALPGPAIARYLETPRYVIPGVESVFQAHLTLSSDPYLVDHDFNGSYLLPTVFGLEAMAQAVASTVGMERMGRLRMENITLQRPITVDPQEGAHIIVRALALEREKDGEKASTVRKVCAWVSKSAGAEGGDYFSADFILNLEDEAPEYVIAKPSSPLQIDPVLDLYRENLMFQGPMFQRLRTVWQIEAHGDEARRAIMDTFIAPVEKTLEDAFSIPEHRAFLLGDPFYRDTLLQSAQLVLPRETSLPVYIGRWDIYPDDDAAPLTVLTEAILRSRQEKEFDTLVTAVDKRGRVREKLDNYTLRVLKHQSDNPSASDLIDPGQRDEHLIEQIMMEASQAMGFEAPTIALRYIPGIHTLGKEDRHALEMPLILDALNRNARKRALTREDKSEEPFEIQWLENGKPVIPALADSNRGFSLSHDERLCICCTGAGAQGIDIAPITPRDREHWITLLGDRNRELLEMLLKNDENLDIAGMRLWTAMEALGKLGETEGQLLGIDMRDNERVLFSAGTSAGPVKIFTVPLGLTWGPRRMLAVTVRPRAVSLSRIAPEKEFEELLSQSHIRLMTGPQGQPCVSMRILVTFRPNAQLSRTVYFSNYMFWAGDIREAAIWPILRQVGEQFSTGKWGSVTNNSRLCIVGEATAQDQIEVRLAIKDNRGPTNSTMDLVFDFLKVLPDDQYERVAWSEVTVTWVRILEHGVVAPESYPEYYDTFMQKMLPRNNNPFTLPPYPESLQTLLDVDGTPDIYKAPPGPTVVPLLIDQAIETSLDHSNLVGNIYFANYYLWQGTVRDRYFYNIIPEFYRGEGQNGELLCLETRINHLREAMPFDRIIVTMALKSLKECNATFSFEYFREEQDRSRTKLAFGEQDAVWVMRDKQRIPYAAPFPIKVMDAFKKAIAG